MSNLLNDLITIVGPGGVLQGEDVSQRSVDWFTGAPCLAMAIVRPRSTEQLSKVMALCYEADQPVDLHSNQAGPMNFCNKDE